MKIIIDYGEELPSDELITKMESYKKWVVDRLEPIWDEIKYSEGILILQTDGIYDIKETPYAVAMKIRGRIDSLNL